MTDTLTVARSLEEALGVGAVTTDPTALAATSHDTWPVATKWSRQGHHPYQGDVLVSVTSVDQVVAVLKIARSTATPVTVRALASSVTGQPLPVRGGIVLDVSRLAGEVDVDTVDMTVTAPASYPGGRLEDELNASGWTMGNSPQSLYRSTVGGWVSTLETGQFSSLYGGIEDLVVGYRVILVTGEEVELKASPRAAMGPDMRQVFIGAEGTLGVIVAVTLKIFPLPEQRLLGTFTMPDVAAGLTFLREQAATGLRPFLLRLYDTDEARHAMADDSVATPILFVGTQGDRRMAETEFTIVKELAEACGGASIGPDGARSWMERRFDFSSVEELLATDGGYAETVEVAHTWRHIGPLYDDLKSVLGPLADEVLVHFSHVYTQGTSMYVILRGRAEDDEAAIARLERIWSIAMRTCLDHGAELSHHHGGGLARSPYAAASLGTAHLVLQRIKQALDPEGLLNPGKLGL